MVDWNDYINNIYTYEKAMMIINKIKQVNIKGLFALVLYTVVISGFGYHFWLTRDVEPTDSDYLDPSRLTYIANNGDADAQYLLGLLYFSGQNVKQNDNDAIIWFKKAAIQNNTDAQIKLCVLLEQNSQKEAFNYCLAAANKNHPEAAAKIGYWYLKGVPGETPNGIKGAQYLSIAAEQGHATAMYNLAQVYYNGAGIPQNTAMAYYWAGLAALTEKTDDVKANVIATQTEWGSKLDNKTKTELDGAITNRFNKGFDTNYN